MEDIHQYRKRFERELGTLEGFPGGRAIADYARSLEARGLNAGWIAKAVYQLKSLRRELMQPFDEADKKSAGGVRLMRLTTADGFEATLQVDYLSHFLLTNLLQVGLNPVL